MNMRWFWKDLTVFERGREFEYHWALLSEEVKKMEQYKSPLAETYRAKLEELYEMYVNRMKR